MANSLDPDQDQHSVGLDLGPKLFAKSMMNKELTMVWRLTSFLWSQLYDGNCQHMLRGVGRMFYLKSQLYLAVKHRDFSKKLILKKKSQQKTKGYAKFPSRVSRIKLGKKVVHKNIQHNTG